MLYKKEIDRLGRLVIPKVILEKLNWNNKDEVTLNVITKNNTLVLKKAFPTCSSCGKKKGLVCINSAIYLCKECLRRFAEDSKNSD